MEKKKQEEKKKGGTVSKTPPLISSFRFYLTKLRGKNKFPFYLE